MLVIAGTVTIDPARREEAMTAAVVMMEETRREPGNLAYVFSGDFESEAVVHIFEHWESQEALDAHFAAPHMAKFQKTLAGLGLQDMSVQKFQVSGVGPLF